MKANEKATATACLRASSLESISDLGLSKRLYNLVKDYRPEDLIYIVRNGSMVRGIGDDRIAMLDGIKGVGKKLFGELEAAVDRAGYIRHDFDNRSLGIEALCEMFDVDYTFGGTTVYTPLKISGLYSSNERYEQYQNFSEQQINEVIALIDELDPKEAEAIKYVFGLESKKTKTSNGERRHMCSRALRRLRHPNYNFRNKLKYIVCMKSEKDCSKILNGIIGELATIYDDPIIKKERMLRRELLEASQLTSFKGPQLLKNFMETSFDSPIKFGTLGFNNSDVVNLRRIGIYTVGDFVMFCFANPDNWLGKASGSVDGIMALLDELESLGVVLPLADKLRDKRFYAKLEDSGLKEETITALKRMYYYDSSICVGGVILRLYRDPDRWFQYRYNYNPDIEFTDALEVIQLITALGFRIPPSDGIVVSKEKGDIPSLEDLNLRNETKQELRAKNIYSMAQLLVAINNYPNDWHERLHLREEAVEILVKMAAMGYLDVFTPDDNADLS